MYTRKYKHSLQAVNYHFWPCVVLHIITFSVHPITNYKRYHYYYRPTLKSKVLINESTFAW